MMGGNGRETFDFEGYTLDLTRGALRKGDREIGLRPKSFALLRYFVENPGRLVSKDELINALWPNVIVGDESLSQCISDVRHAVDDQHRHGRRIIKTVHGRGYLFDAPVSVQPRRSRPVDAALPVEAPLPLPDKPSLAVLPFENMTGNAEQEYFVDGMVEEIITALSRIRWLFVIARNSSFTLQGPERRCDTNRARARSVLRARRLGAQSRRAGAHHRAADRRSQWCAPLG
jgi:DNA-binding winged helix-turn-helix (wHTH) protein